MAIDVVCPAGHQFRVKDRYAGRSGRCPQCGDTVVVPYADTIAWRPPAEEAAPVKSAPPSGAPGSALRPGGRLGRFELQAVLGQGAFGTVYKAHDPQLDRQVALKVPRVGQLEDFVEIDRFLREARAAGQLRHPHIVPVYDAGKIDDTFYIAAGFVSGCTLQAALKTRRRFPPREAAEIVRKLASALHYAHGAGVIHRDLKPANIMVDDKGEPHVMDFGLARRLSGEILRTMEGTRMGTPAYMSPEQADGRGHLADGRSDLWSLGVILYELIVGRRPFDGGEVEVMVALQTKDPLPLRKIDSTIPRDLETICFKCLSKDPGKRYPTCRHLADELGRFLAGDAIVARRTPLWERTARWIKRNRVVSLLGSLVLGVSLSFAAVSWSMVKSLKNKEQQLTAALSKANAATGRAQDALAQTQREADARLRAEAEALAASEAREEALRERQTALEAKDTAEKTRESAEQELTAAEMAKHQAEQQAALAAQTATDLEKEKKELLQAREGNQRLLGNYVECLALANLAIDRGEHEIALENLARCDPDKRSWEWRYTLRRAKKLAVRHEVSASDPLSSSVYWDAVDFDPRGMFLATVLTQAQAQSVGILDLKKLTWKLEPLPKKYSYVCFASDSTQLLATSRNGAWALLDASSLGKKIDSGLIHEDHSLIKIDGQTRIVNGRRASNGQIRIRDAQQPKKFQSIRFSENVGGTIALSQNLKYAAFPSQNAREIRIWDIMSGESRILKGSDKSWVLCGFVDDDRAFASFGRARSLRVWDIISGETVPSSDSHVASLYSAMQAIACEPRSRLDLTADGKRLAEFDDHKMQLFDVVTGILVFELQLSQGSEGKIPKPQSHGFSPDGRWLAVKVPADRETHLVLFDAGDANGD